MMKAEIVIVGGGLSGLHLAAALERQGADFLLLEARDRLGGRILSKDVGGARFDLGPAWFWPGQPLMAALVEKLNLRVFEQYSSGDIVAEDHNGAVHRGAGFASMQGSYRIDGGLQALIDGLAQRVFRSRIRLGARVRELARHPDGVAMTVDSDGGAFMVQAQQVVFAVPPRVVEASIRFTPSLSPNIADCLKSIPTWMAGQAKILAVYDRPHWRDAHLSGDAMSRRGPLVEVHDASPRAGGPFAVFGFVGVAPAVRRLHRDQVIELAREQLGRLFGASMLQPTALVLEDWSQSDLTASELDLAPGVGHPKYGFPAALDGLWDTQLLFAGTEMAQTSGGFLEGALEAAEQVAKRLAGRSSLDGQQINLAQAPPQAI